MRILTIAVLVFLGACSEKEQSVMDSVEVKNIIAKQPTYVAPSAPAVTIEQGCMDESLKVRLCWPILENAIAKKYPELLQRKENVLGITLINGEKIEVKNDEEHEYAFVKYLPEIQYGLLTVKLKKEITFDLVNLKTGAKTRIGGNVLLSPDKHRLAVFPVDNDEGLTPNVVAVYLVTANDVLKEYQNESSKWRVSDLGWINSETIEVTTVDPGDRFNDRNRNILLFAGKDTKEFGEWKADTAINVLLKYGQGIASHSCESPVISKEEDTNSYDDSIKDVITTRVCPTHKVISRSFNNNKPPIIRTEEVDLFSNKFQPALGLLIGTSKAKIIDILGNPDVSNSAINKMVYWGTDEGGCSSSINFILDKEVLNEIRWGFCNE